MNKKRDIVRVLNQEGGTGTGNGFYAIAQTELGPVCSP